MSLQNSTTFQKEYQDFKNSIALISDPNIKSQAHRLLTDLLYEVRRIDSIHQELSFQQTPPENIGLSRNKLLDIRKKLSKLIVV